MLLPAFNAGSTIVYKQVPNLPHKRLLILTFAAAVGVGLYAFAAHVAVTVNRLKLLHELATHHDPFDIEMQLAELFEGAGDIAGAVAWYKRAGLELQQRPRPGLSLKISKHCMPYHELTQSWENLICRNPLAPDVRVGCAEYFKQQGWLRLAELECRQALTLSPANHNQEAEDLLLALVRLEECEPAPMEAESSTYNGRCSALARSWHPPSHSGFLLSRCAIYARRNGTLDVVLRGSSGSAAHDRSALALLKSFDFQGTYVDCHVFDCASENGRKTIAYYDYGSVNSVDMPAPSPIERLEYAAQDASQAMNRQLGVFRL